MTKIHPFPLQKVLDYRQTVEDTKTLALQKSKADLQREEAKYGDLELRKNTVLENAQAEHQNTEHISVTNLQQSTDYIAQLNTQLKQQSDQVRKSHQEVEEIMEKLLSASRDRKIIEKLKEKFVTESRREFLKKEEQKEGEVAIRITKGRNAIDGEQ